MTRAQLEALRALRTPKGTTKNSRHGYVGGQTCAALVRRGWARRLSVQELDGTQYYVITPAGEAALAVKELLAAIAAGAKKRLRQPRLRVQDLSKPGAAR